MYKMFVIRQEAHDVYISSCTRISWTIYITDAVHFSDKESAEQFCKCIKGMGNLEVVAIKCKPEID